MGLKACAITPGPDGLFTLASHWKAYTQAESSAVLRGTPLQHMRGCVETTVRLNAAGPNKVRKSKESRVIPAGSLSVQVLIKALFTDVVCFPQCLTAVLETKTTTPRAEKAVFRNTTVTLGL